MQKLPIKKVSNFSILFSVRKVIATVLIAVGFLSLASAAHAATLAIDKIGGVAVGLTMPTSWIHQGSNPLFIGDASPSASVQVSINGLPYTATANALGQWSYQPTTLTTNGSHEIVVSSGIENLIFTLTLTSATGSASTTTTTATTSTATQPALPAQLPSTGSGSAILFFGAGMLLLGLAAVTVVAVPSYFEQEL